MTNDLEAEVEERVGRVGRVYARTPEVKRANALIDRTRRLRRQGGGAFCSLITGVSGCGKTRIFELYKERQLMSDTDSIPVLMFSVPTPFTFVGFLDTILTALNVEGFAGRQSVSEMLKRVHLYLGRKKVELILMEEASQIIDRKGRTAKVPYWATDAIKMHLLDGARVPVVMNGIPIAKELFKLNTQLESRRCGFVELEPYDLADRVSRERFMLLVEMFERAAGFPEAVLAKNDALCVRLHRATGGIHGEVAKLMKEATDIGIRKAASSLNVEVLAEAHARLAVLETGWVNPFLVDEIPARKTPDESRVTPLHKRVPSGRNAAA